MSNKGPSLSAVWEPLCALTDIDDGSAREFCLHPIGTLFVVRDGGRYYAYRNLCPHRNLPLNWRPNDFIDVDSGAIMCANHGALFAVDSGVCIAGPCLQRSLTRLELRITAPTLFIRVSESDA